MLQNPAQKLSTVRNFDYRWYFTYTIFYKWYVGTTPILLTDDTVSLKAMILSEYKVLHVLRTILHAENGEIAFADMKARISSYKVTFLSFPLKTPRNWQRDNLTTVN